MTKNNYKYDLEDRLINFSVRIIKMTESLSKTVALNHLVTQIVRSGTSVSLNYGEAQSAETRKDFIHKMKIVLKELRETIVCLKIIEKLELKFNLESLIKENDELIAIFVRSIETSKQKLLKNGNVYT